jgi:hypothetical protein
VDGHNYQKNAYFDVWDLSASIIWENQNLIELSTNHRGIEVTLFSFLSSASLVPSLPSAFQPTTFMTRLFCPAVAGYKNA